jgi:hypothetical protein
VLAAGNDFRGVGNGAGKLIESLAKAGPVDAEAIAAAEFPLTIVNRAPHPSTEVLRIAAFNARWGGRPGEIIACLRRPPLNDLAVILLSEADRNMRRSANHDVAAEVAEALGMSVAYVPEFAPRNQMPYPYSFHGNAILSAYPLSALQAITLPNYRQPRRVRRFEGSPRALTATITPNGRPLIVCVAHLNSRTSPAGREGQMSRLMAALPDGQAIIAGDFNTTTVELAGSRDLIKVMLLMLLRPRRFRTPIAYEPLFARLLDAGFRVEGGNTPARPTFTFSGAVPRWARPKLDWIALRGLEPVDGSAEVVAARIGRFRRRISDHDFVICAVNI